MKMARNMIDADEFLQLAERRKKYLILQYKKTDDKKYYHRLDELRRAEDYIKDCIKNHINVKVGTDNDGI